MAASDHRSPASSANDGASGTVGSIRSSSANASTRLLDLVHLGHVANFRATVPLTAQPLALSASKAWRFSLPLSRERSARRGGAETAASPLEQTPGLRPSHRSVGQAAVVRNRAVSASGLSPQQP